MAEIPPSVLRDLNTGRIETLTLVEWLAIDAEKLVRAVAPALGAEEAADDLIDHARRLKRLGIMQRTEGMGAALHSVLKSHPRREAILRRAASHPSDTVRTWAAYAIAAFPELPLEDRLEIIRPFAADSHMGVREVAWLAVRPHISQDLEKALNLLSRWTAEPDENLRRFATEATRPRGVWCAHISTLKENPELGLPVLEPLRSDPSLYVRRSVANWLNDASKSGPDWVKRTTTRWLRESRTKETAWIVNHATRTIRKKESRS